MSPDDKPIRVAVVEDHQEDRERIVRLLNNSPGFACVAACASGTEAVQVVPPLSPDVVLMDIQMPGLSGIHCARVLKVQLPRTEIMMLTVVEDHERIYQSLAAGATGYLLKKTPPPKLLEAIQELHAGGAPMSGQIARQVVAAFQQPAGKSHTPAEQLSPNEQQVLQLLARGLLYKEVAAELNIAQATVRTHVWHIYRKLHAHNRTEAISKGLHQTQSR